MSQDSPPLFRNPNTPTPFEDYDFGETYGHEASPEDLLVEKQLLENFSSLLSERELQIFKMSEGGMSVDEIATSVGCSARTVIKDRNSIFDKCRVTLNV